MNRINLPSLLAAAEKATPAMFLCSPATVKTLCEAANRADGSPHECFTEGTPCRQCDLNAALSRLSALNNEEKAKS